MKSVRRLFAGLALTGAVAALATIDVNPAQAQAGKKAIEGKGLGTIKGKATLDGDAPAPLAESVTTTSWPSRTSW